MPGVQMPHCAPPHCDERLLNRAELFAAREPFDRANFGAGGLRRRNETTIHERAIEKHRSTRRILLRRSPLSCPSISTRGAGHRASRSIGHARKRRASPFTVHAISILTTSSATHSRLRFERFHQTFGHNRNFAQDDSGGVLDRAHDRGRAAIERQFADSLRAARAECVTASPQK